MANFSVGFSLERGLMGTIIYAHIMQCKTMFGDFASYQSSSWSLCKDKKMGQVKTSAPQYQVAGILDWWVLALTNNSMKLITIVETITQ